jgi:hypothetical protein
MIIIESFARVSSPRNPSTIPARAVKVEIQDLDHSVRLRQATSRVLKQPATA